MSDKKKNKQEQIVYIFSTWNHYYRCCPRSFELKWLKTRRCRPKTPSFQRKPRSNAAQTKNKMEIQQQNGNKLITKACKAVLAPVRKTAVCARPYAAPTETTKFNVFKKQCNMIGPPIKWDENCIGALCSTQESLKWNCDASDIRNPQQK